MLLEKPSNKLVHACQGHMLPYMQYMHLGLTGAPFITAPFHVRLCDALERVFVGLIMRLIVSMPPRSGKTDIFIRGFISWAMGHFPESMFLNTSYGAELAVNNAYDARLWMQSEPYAHIFGRPQFTSDAVANYKTTAGGVVYSAGSDGALTGFGAGLMRDKFGGCALIDDGLKPQDAHSALKRESVNRWYLNTFQSRRNSAKTPVVITAQRLHVNDLPGFLLAGGSGERWEYIEIPALDENDQTFWEHMPAEDLKRLRAADPRMFSAQYQQKPVILGGNIFKGSFFGRWSVLPAQLEWRAVFADTAQKEKEANDFTVFQCLGVKAGTIYVIDQIRHKWGSPTELKKAAVDFWNKHAAADRVLMGHLRKLYVEDKSSGTGLIQDLKKETGIPVEGIERSRDKYSRALDVLGYYEAGRVVIPAAAPWVSEYIAEHEAFTPNDSHDHDDQIDPTMDAVNKMLVQKGGAAVWSNPALFK